MVAAVKADGSYITELFAKNGLRVARVRVTIPEGQSMVYAIIFENKFYVMKAGRYYEIDAPVVGSLVDR